MQSWKRRGAEGQGSQICRFVLENRYDTLSESYSLHTSRCIPLTTGFLKIGCDRFKDGMTSPSGLSRLNFRVALFWKLYISSFS